MQQELRFDSLRDPTGLQSFKRLINSFTNGIDSIYAEKEQQYTTMRAVCGIMDDMHKRKGEHDGQETSTKAKQAALIAELMQEKDQLNKQLELIK